MPPKLLPHPGAVVGAGVVLSVVGTSTGGNIVLLPGTKMSGSSGSPSVLHIPPISIPGVL